MHKCKVHIKKKEKVPDNIMHSWDLKKISFNEES